MNTDFEERRQAELDALLLDPFADTAFDDLPRLASDVRRADVGHFHHRQRAPVV